MSYLLTVTHKAVKDIEEAFDFYENREVGLGENFLDAVRLTHIQIAEAPLMYAKIYHELRRMKVIGFQHLIIYDVNEPERRVTTLAVRHERSDIFTYLEKLI